MLLDWPLVVMRWPAHGASASDAATAAKALMPLLTLTRPIGRSRRPDIGSDGPHRARQYDHRRRRPIRAYKPVMVRSSFTSWTPLAIQAAPTTASCSVQVRT